jgi:hypothetical protein
MKDRVYNHNNVLTTNRDVHIVVYSKKVIFVNKYFKY